MDRIYIIKLNKYLDKLDKISNQENLREKYINNKKYLEFLNLILNNLNNNIIYA